MTSLHLDLPILALAIGSLAVFGIAIVLLVRSLGDAEPFPRCRRCAYDLSGSVDPLERCPECGASLAEVPIIPAGHGRPQSMRPAVALLLLSAVLLVLAVLLMAL